MKKLFKTLIPIFVLFFSFSVFGEDEKIFPLALIEVDEDISKINLKDLKKLKTRDIENLLFGKSRRGNGKATLGFFEDGRTFEYLFIRQSRWDNKNLKVIVKDREFYSIINNSNSVFMKTHFKYKGDFKISQSKVCFQKDAYDDWKCFNLYKKKNNNKEFYWVHKKKIYAKITKVMLIRDYKKMKFDNSVEEKERRKKEKRLAEEMRLAEEKRKDEERIAKEKKLAEQERLAEEKRKKEERLAEKKNKKEERLVEEKRKEEERLAEEKRIAEEKKFSEEKKIAEEKRIAEENRLAEKRRIDNELLAKIKKIIPIQSELQEAQYYINDFIDFYENNTTNFDILELAKLLNLTKPILQGEFDTIQQENFLLFKNFVSESDEFINFFQENQNEIKKKEIELIKDDYNLLILNIDSLKTYLDKFLNTPSADIILKKIEDADLVLKNPKSISEIENINIEIVSLLSKIEKTSVEKTNLIKNIKFLKEYLKENITSDKSIEIIDLINDGEEILKGEVLLDLIIINDNIDRLIKSNNFITNRQIQEEKEKEEKELAEAKEKKEREQKKREIEEKKRIESLTKTFSCEYVISINDQESIDRERKKIPNINEIEIRMNEETGYFYVGGRSKWDNVKVKNDYASAQGFQPPSDSWNDSVYQRITVDFKLNTKNIETFHSPGSGLDLNDFGKKKIWSIKNSGLSLYWEYFDKEAFDNGSLFLVTSRENIFDCKNLSNQEGNVQNSTNSKQQQLLTDAYVYYIMIKKLYESRIGYAVVYVNDVQMRKAKKQIQDIEQILLNEFLLDEDLIWSLANKKYEQDYSAVDLTTSTGAYTNEFANFSKLVMMNLDGIAEDVVGQNQEKDF